MIDDTYVAALASSQNGVPSRPMEQVAHIIETSVGQTMEELFQYFEIVPIEAARVAQAHKARLRNGTNVIVKVQYPEVAKLYQADCQNLKWATKFIAPKCLLSIVAIQE